MEAKKPMSTPGSNEPTYLAWSIFNTICCCTPLGIIAIVFSCRTDTANLIGDPTRASAHSRMAKNLNIASLVIGIIFLIAFIAIYVVLFQHISENNANMGR